MFSIRNVFNFVLLLQGLFASFEVCSIGSDGLYVLYSSTNIRHLIMLIPFSFRFVYPQILF